MIDGEYPPATQLKPVTALTVEIRGDEATVRLEVEKGAPDVGPMFTTAKHLVEVLAEKRLAWWHPIDGACEPPDPWIQGEKRPGSLTEP